MDVKHRLLLLLSGTAAANPAWHADQGASSSASATTVTTTILTDIPVGGFFRMSFWNTNSRSVSGGVTDDAAGGPNTYSTASYSFVAPADTTHRLHMVTCKVTVAMPAGTIVTATLSGGAAWAKVAQSFSDTGAVPVDLTGAGASGGSDTTPIIPSPGTPSQPVSLETAVVWAANTVDNPDVDTLTASGWSNQIIATRNLSGRLFMQSRLSTDGTAAGLTGTLSTARIWSGRSQTVKGA